MYCTTLTKSNLNSLSIGSGLVVAVLLCVKRGRTSILHFPLHVVFAFLLVERFQNFKIICLGSLVSGLVSENVGQIGGYIGR